MASSKKRRSSEFEVRIKQALALHVPPHARLILALSGGIDSAALLDVLAALAPHYPFTFSCLHVNHRISPHAERWARFARSLARHYQVRCMVKTVDLTPYRSMGLEGAARAARYAAFAQCKADFVVLAQHQDDQAETVLLQLIRGSGVAGVAAMPSLRSLEASEYRASLLRPMLGISRAEIEAYALRRGLKWVDDESNDDIRLARNFVRHRVMPRLRELNPVVAANLARSAVHFGEAAELMEMLAAIDAAAVIDGGAIDLNALRALPRSRARNLMRALFAQGDIAMPSALELEQILDQLLHAKRDAQIVLDLGGGIVLRRFDNHAWLLPQPTPLDPGYRAHWNGGRTWPLPELGGCFRFEAVRGKGIAAAAMSGARVSVRLRRGGERFQPDAGRPRRTLKNLMHEEKIPPWLRDRLPLLYCGDTLAFVPGIGIAAELRAGPDMQGMVVTWLPADGIGEMLRARLVLYGQVEPKPVLK